MSSLRGRPPSAPADGRARDGAGTAPLPAATESAELLDEELEWVVGGLERAWPPHADDAGPG